MKSCLLIQRISIIQSLRKGGGYVVCGGYHTTALPEEAGSHCDTMIVEPAEISIPQFIEDYMHGTPRKVYKNFDVCAAQFVIPARDKVSELKKRKNMPEYRYLGHYTTYCFHGGRKLLGIEKDNLEGFGQLMKTHFAAQTGFSLLIWGGFENNPLCPTLDRMRTIHYGSRLYSVLWDDQPTLSGIIGVEVALL